MIITGQFADFYGKTMLPALRQIVWTKFNEYPEQWSQFVRSETSTRSIEQFSQVSGVGLFSKLTEGQPVGYDQPVQGFKSTFVHTRYGLGVKVSQDTIEDDQHGLVAEAHADLGRSCRESIEIDVASIFNNGFDGTNYPGPDGKALFASDHPLIKAGGSQSNLLSVAADLDVSSLQLALTDFETMKDSAGRRIRMPLPRLVVHPSNRWNAAEILKGDMRSDTANHTINAFKYAEGGNMMEFKVWQYLTDPDAWFLCGSPRDTKIAVFWRRKPYSKADFDFDTETGKFAMRYKKSQGWWDFYGVYGTPGA